WCVPFTEQLAGLFGDFVGYKRRHGLADFDDLLLLWRGGAGGPPAPAARAGVFGDFVGYKRRHGLADFDDLLLLWRAALADPAAGAVLRGLFDAVLVDEYQDVNAIQADIVRLLRPEGPGLTCVGDDAQAI